MKYSRIVSFCFLLLAPTQVLSNQMFAGFDEFCGLPVIVGYDPQTASARRDPYGNPFIHVDPGVMSNWTMSRRFTLAHECAHHLLGHTNGLGMAERYYGGTKKQELEADCWAAKKLSEIGFDGDISRTVLQHASQGHFSAGGYPSGAERASNIARCVSKTSMRHSRRSRSCRYVNTTEVYQDIEVQMQTVQVPCGHCGYNAWGQYGCYHAFDLVNQPVQVPVTRSRPVKKKVCD